MTIWESRIANEVATFKQRWADADADGLEGHRVESAILPIVEALYAAEEKIERLDALLDGYQSLMEAGRMLPFTGYLPPTFAPQWRARAETAEAKVAEFEANLTPKGQGND